MANTLFLELEGPHYQTGERMRRYVGLTQCSCRRRLDRFTLPSQVETTARTCERCGEGEQVDLRRAQPAPRRKRADCYQDTRCRECGCEFALEHSIEDGDRLSVACPCCRSVKTMVRRPLRAQEDRP